MTKTELKLRDAVTQLRLANRDPVDEEIVRSCINSFISHARSVTFVMRRESTSSSKLLAWYEKKIAHLGNLPLAKFFNAQRVYSIHKGVVDLNRQQYTVFDFADDQEPVSDGPPKHPFTFKIKADSTMMKSGDVAILHGNELIGWYFDNVTAYLPQHSGNVFAICQDYFMALKSLVIQWLREKAWLQEFNMTGAELQNRMNELIHLYNETHDETVKTELEELKARVAATSAV